MVPKNSILGQMYNPKVQPWQKLCKSRRNLEELLSQTVRALTSLEQASDVSTASEDKEPELWGPKTAELPPGDKLDPQDLETMIDVNKALSPDQQVKLQEIVQCRCRWEFSL